MATPYINPTQINPVNNDFGAGQYQIPSIGTPFPFEQQRNQNEQLVSGFEQALQGQETIPQLQGRLEQRYNIPQLREAFQAGTGQLSDINALISSMPETVAGTTRESMVTESQRQNLLASKTKPLYDVAARIGENVSRVGQMLTSSEQNLNTTMQAEIAQQKKMLQPWEWKYNMQDIQQAREMTGWSTAQQQELNRLISNQNAGLTWTNAERDRAQQLALEEKRYNLELKKVEQDSELGLDLWY